MGLVDPRLLGQAGWVGSAVEPFGVGVTGPVEGGLALGADVVSGPVVDRGGVCSPIPEWRCSWL